MEYLISGFGHVLNPVTLFWIAVGVTLGYVLGALPGLGKATGVAVAIPLTFYLDPVSAIAMLIGIAKGSAAGSAVSAILLNTPGEPSSAPTALDGYPLARQGKAQKALKMGLFASVIGDFVSTLILIGLAAPLASYALLIGPVELCAILLFSLTFIGGLSGNSLTKGLIAGAFGRLWEPGAGAAGWWMALGFALVHVVAAFALLGAAKGRARTGSAGVERASRHHQGDHPKPPLHGTTLARGTCCRRRGWALKQIAARELAT
mgnify:CR=1 FL=1